MDVLAEVEVRVVCTLLQENTTHNIVWHKHCEVRIDNENTSKSERGILAYGLWSTSLVN